MSTGSIKTITKYFNLRTSRWALKLYLIQCARMFSVFLTSSCENLQENVQFV